jgi:hypothetical protein
MRPERRSRRRSLSANSSPKRWTRVAHALVADADPSLCEQFLDIAVAEGEAGVKPDGVADYLSRKVEAAVRIGALGHGRIGSGRRGQPDVFRYGIKLRPSTRSRTRPCDKALSPQCRPLPRPGARSTSRSASASSPRLPTDGSMPASAKRSVQRIERNCADSTPLRNDRMMRGVFPVQHRRQGRLYTRHGARIHGAQGGADLHCRKSRSAVYGDLLSSDREATRDRPMGEGSTRGAAV